MKWARVTLLVLTLSLSIVLGACGNGASTSADLADYPVSVHDGIVSVEYYEQIQEFYSESVAYLTDIADAEENGIDSTELLNEYNEVLLNFKVKPITKADKDIDFQLRSVIRFQSDLNSFKIEYFKSNNTDLKWDITTTASMLAKMAEELGEVVDEYGVGY